MNLKEIREMINLMNDNDLTEIEVEREGTKIKLKKASGEYIVEPARPRPIEYRQEAQPAELPAGGAGADAANANTKEITSPMVGTFYRSPSPESPPFVEVGQIVEVGQVVCIIEAMKLMNEIKSEIRGKVVAAPIDNAQPVEFGQPLFVIEPQ
ncbi:MAG: acetyl-CoA carboxylase biotin carboxyl carrier protein [Candidatus Omnitrophica bacterium]|nr:acetyl-CoA carboxylase biotin carboxyl carrier protein [Candidatus Omnitrophota bacterium]